MNFNSNASLISVDLFNQGPAELVVALPVTSRAKGIPFHVPVDKLKEGSLSPVLSSVKISVLSPKTGFQNVWVWYPRSPWKRLKIACGFFWIYDCSASNWGNPLFYYQIPWKFLSGIKKVFIFKGGLLNDHCQKIYQEIVNMQVKEREKLFTLRRKVHSKAECRALSEPVC